jgi:hypothetical protein
MPNGLLAGKWLILPHVSGFGSELPPMAGLACGLLGKNGKIGNRKN